MDIHVCSSPMPTVFTRSACTTVCDLPGRLQDRVTTRLAPRTGRAECSPVHTQVLVLETVLRPRGGSPIWSSCDLAEAQPRSVRQCRVLFASMVSQCLDVDSSASPSSLTASSEEIFGGTLRRAQARPLTWAGSHILVPTLLPFYQFLILVIVVEFIVELIYPVLPISTSCLTSRRVLQENR